MSEKGVPISAIYWKPLVREQDVNHFSREGFRGAVNEAIHQFIGAPAPVHFHHHGVEEEFDDGFVQFRLVRHPSRKGLWVPMVVAVGAPAQLLAALGEHLERSTQWNGVEIRNMGIRLEVLVVRKPFVWKPTIQRHDRTYELEDWLPLSPKNKRMYEAERSLVARVQLLDRIVEGNVRQLCKRAGVPEVAAEAKAWLIRFKREAISKEDADVWNPDQLKLFGQSRNRMDVVIATNLNIPEEISIGQGSTLGFGRLIWHSNRKKFSLF